MAFLSKILFKPNKVLEILPFVSSDCLMKCSEHSSGLCQVWDVSVPSLISPLVSAQTDAHYSSLVNED